LILQAGEFLFIHGSITDAMIKSNINPRTGKVDIYKINSDVSKWLMGKGKVPHYLEDTGKDNPVFSRVYSEDKTLNVNNCNRIRKQIDKFHNANHVVMGHSTYSSINTTCKRMLIRTDVSLSRAFGGELENKKLQALEILQNGGEPILNIITELGKKPLK